MSNLAFNFPRDTFLGFDQLFNTLTEINPDVARGSGYPPYNVIKKDDGHFLIEIAVAGFSKHDIDLTLEGGVLTVTGNKKAGTDKREYTLILLMVYLSLFWRTIFQKKINLKQLI
jgi:molecular chaperone IbpA